MLFKVQSKSSKEVYDVYHIRQDALLGNIYFLIYAGDEWKEMLASGFAPYNGDKKVLNG